MKLLTFVSLSMLLFGCVQASAQSPTDPGRTRDRVVVTSTIPPAKPITNSVPKPSPTPIIVGNREGTIDEGGTVVAKQPSKPVEIPASSDYRSLSFSAIKNKLAEAKRSMQARPMATASSDSNVPMDFVRIAFHDWTTGKMDYVVMAKAAFLARNEVKQTVSQNGRNITARTIRGNGVNTPVTLTDDNGVNHLPLMVQYPVIRDGKYIETAYYMSTHPGLVTPEVVAAGRFYVRNVIELAREKLRDKGIVIQPKIADIAERLAAVEHVDHLRFRTEKHSNIYDDVYTLFALNEGQTYRYAVSTAGAGGMVQMIPSTYRMVRSWHPNVALMPDFVEGMRDHVNASQAMLLYMQRTWNDLLSSTAVRNALDSGIATQEQLMAAGYNSNPARLPGYINRGAAGWTNLIPRETKIYLQIFDSVEKNVPMASRNR